MPDLSTPEATREFLRLCLNPPARGPRTPAKLVEIMPAWLRAALDGHAPELAVLHADTVRLEKAAARARAVEVTALEQWVEGQDVERGDVEQGTTDFFQPGLTYRRGRFWTFQCLAVGAAPWNAEIRAVGFLTRTDSTGAVHGMTADDWAHGEWTAIETTTNT